MIYDYTITRIEPRRHYLLRYEIKIYWDKDNGDIGWSYTYWGAYLVIRRMARKHNVDAVPENKIVVKTGEWYEGK